MEHLYMLHIRVAMTNFRTGTARSILNARARSKLGNSSTLSLATLVIGGLKPCRKAAQSRRDYTARSQSAF